MHHPSCWVRNRGCATQQDHEQFPDPVAFARARPAPPPSPHPAEGTRLRRPVEPVIGETILADESPEDIDDLDADDDFGADGSEADDADEVEESGEYSAGVPAGSPGLPPRRHAAPTAEPSRAVRHGRYEPMETIPVRRTMPRVYRRNPILRYWYLPVAVIVGGAIAAGVVFLSDRLFSGDSESAPGSLPTATQGARTTVASPSPLSSASPGVTATASAQASVTPSATARPGQGTATASPSVTGGQFSPGIQVLVTGTGDCLNVREAPTTQSKQLSCIADNVEATVLSGPADADGFRWWKIRAEGIVEGWVVENYLRRKP